MKIKYKVLFAAVLLIISILSIIVLAQKFEKVSYSMSTKAVCNQNNYCEDYEIYCKNENVEKTSATGMAIQLPNNWKDLRNSSEFSC